MVRQSGFTIIEVLLFLAVSGLLFMIAASSLNATIRNTRLTDATNGLENFVSQQYSDVRSGVSFRSDAAQTCGVGGAGAAELPGASDDCIVVGRLLDFVATGGSADPNAINVYSIVANRCPQNTVQPTENGCPNAPGVCANTDSSDAGKIATYCPRVLWANQLDSYNFQWGVSLPPNVAGGTFQNPRVAQVDSSQPRINRLAIIHSPTSERIYTYAFNDPATPTNTQVIDRTKLVRNTADRNVMMCISGMEFGATLSHFVSIEAGQSSDLVTSGAVRPVAQMPGGMAC